MLQFKQLKLSSTGYISLFLNVRCNCLFFNLLHIHKIKELKPIKVFSHYRIRLSTHRWLEDAHLSEIVNPIKKIIIQYNLITYYSWFVILMYSNTKSVNELSQTWTVNRARTLSTIKARLVEDQSTAHCCILARQVHFLLISLKGKKTCIHLA